MVVEMELKDKVRSGYLDYLLTHGRRPVSVFAFAKQESMEEADFYALYNSFDAIEQEIWTAAFAETKTRLGNDEAYKGYSARERLLALHFTWFEVWKPHRSYALFTWNTFNKRVPKTPNVLKMLQKQYVQAVNEILNTGFDNGELVSRPFLADKYGEGLWIQFLMLNNYWLKDTSSDFEDTDAAIEKSVRLSFELMGANVVDAATDFVKFLFQKRR